jgi:hypothetical protein
LGVTILIVYAPAWDAEIAAEKKKDKGRPAGTGNLSTDDNKIRFNSVFRQLIKLRAEVANKDAPSVTWYAARTSFENAQMQARETMIQNGTA